MLSILYFSWVKYLIHLFRMKVVDVQQVSEVLSKIE